MLSVYLTLSYDGNYSEANENQTSTDATTRNASDISRIGKILSRRQKEYGFCDRSGAVCHNYGDVSLASLCGRWRTRRISSAGADLTDFARLINTLLQLGC